jgi:protein-S-isoprenylcysteine O-methyltransferase Ste14
MNMENVAMFIAMGLWLGSEIAITITRRGKGLVKEERRGKATNALILSVSMASIVVATFVGFLAKFMDIRWLYSPVSLISDIGLGLIVVGVVIRCAAVLTLRENFTVDVAIVENHTLVKTGIFRLIRHPSYLGALLCLLGLGISYVNWLSIIILIIPNCFTIFIRMNEEEKVLVERFGDEYRKYMTDTKRLIPFVY